MLRRLLLLETVGYERKFSAKLFFIVEDMSPASPVFYGVESMSLPIIQNWVFEG